MGAPQGFAPEKTLTDNQRANRDAVWGTLMRRGSRGHYPGAHRSMSRVGVASITEYHDEYLLEDNARVEARAREGALRHHQTIQDATGAKP